MYYYHIVFYAMFNVLIAIICYETYTLLFDKTFSSFFKLPFDHKLIYYERKKSKIDPTDKIIN